MYVAAKFLLWIVVLFAFLSCATPMSPTGGTPDRSGPKLERTIPENETVNFSGDYIQFTFADFVDRNSFEQAFRLEPDVAVRYTIRWRRKTARVQFQNPLPENTTIVFSLGTDLRDTRNNRLQNPIRIAVSTGAEIDSGALKARMLRANDGKREERGRLLLYREPVHLAQPALYVGDPDTAGRVQFSYLSEGNYQLFWVDDRNRNRTWDQAREQAQPFMKEFFEVKSEQETDAGTVFITEVDTIAPMVQAVGVHTSQRLRIRFSEPIIVQESPELHITADDGFHSDVVPLFLQPGDENILFAETRNAMEENRAYVIHISGVTDRAGNSLRDPQFSFPGSAQQDTVINRIIRHDTKHGIFDTEPIAIRFSKIISEPEIQDSLIVIAGSQEFRSWEFVRIEDNVLYIYPDESWQAGVSYEFRIWNPNTMSRQTFRTEIWQANDLGILEITRDGSLPEGYYFFQLTHQSVIYSRSGHFINEITLDQLPPGKYTLRIFYDPDKTQQWNFGRITPFEAPNFHDVIRNIPVQRGMTGQLQIAS